MDDFCLLLLFLQLSKSRHDQLMRITNWLINRCNTSHHHNNKEVLGRYGFFLHASILGFVSDSLVQYKNRDTRYKTKPQGLSGGGSRDLGWEAIPP